MPHKHVVYFDPWACKRKDAFPCFEALLLALRSVFFILLLAQKAAQLEPRQRIKQRKKQSHTYKHTLAVQCNCNLLKLRSLLFIFFFLAFLLTHSLAPSQPANQQGYENGNEKPAPITVAHVHSNVPYTHTHTLALQYANTHTYTALHSGPVSSYVTTRSESFSPVRSNAFAFHGVSA